MPENDHDKIIEMYTDIKWMREDAERRNGILEEHIAYSDKYRKEITRNTIWRHSFKFLIAFMFCLMGYMLRVVLK